MQEKPKFCKQCKYFAESEVSPIYYCRHPNNGISFVTGEPKIGEAYENRACEHLCGKEAKWFEDRPPKPVPPPATETMYKSDGVYSNNRVAEENPWYKFWK